MTLAHHRCQPPLELPEKIAEPAVAIAFRMSVPNTSHKIIRLKPCSEFARQRHPVRLGAPPLARLETGLGEEPVFENAVGELRRERPADPGLFRPFEIILGSYCAPAQACARSRGRSPRHDSAEASVVSVAWSALSSPAFRPSSLSNEEQSNARVADPRGLGS